MMLLGSLDACVLTARAVAGRFNSVGYEIRSAVDFVILVVCSAQRSEAVVLFRSDAVARKNNAKAKRCRQAKDMWGAKQSFWGIRLTPNLLAAARVGRGPLLTHSVYPPAESSPASRQQPTLFEKNERKKEKSRKYRHLHRDIYQL